MKKKYKVTLTKEEVEKLQQVVRKGKAAAYKIRRANIFLKADEGEYGPGWTDKKIAEAFGVRVRTVERLRQQLVMEGFEGILQKKKGNPRKRKIDGRKEAHLTTLACSQAPEGYARWTIRLLADKMVELNYINDISHETVRQTLKKMKLSLG